MTDDTRSARCECGGVAFTVRGEMREVLNCHCSQCRRMHGAYGAFTAAERSALTMTAENTLAWYPSSDFARRGFCNRCGANVFYDVPARDTVSISAGLFEQPSGLKAGAHIFTDEMADYCEIGDELPQHGGFLNDPMLPEKT